MSKHNITLCRYSENMQVIAGLSVPLVAEHCQQNLPSSHQHSQGRVAAMPPTLDDHMIQLMLVRRKHFRGVKELELSTNLRKVRCQL